jgi:hypothetical protein
MDPLDYLQSRIADLDRAIYQLEDSAMTADEETALQRMIEIRGRMEAAVDLLRVDQPQPR